MKKYIKNSQCIFGMAVPRAKALEILKKNSETLAYHLIKCVVYGDSFGADVYKHWVEYEICEYLSIANDVITKPKNRKLKTENYLDTVFADMGTTRQDASVALRNFRIENRKAKEYPDFEVTPELVDSVFVTFQNVIEYALPVLTSNNTLTAEDMSAGVYQAIQQYNK